MQLLAGRDFTVRDNASGPLVAIINETAAHHYFDGRNPVGKQFQFDDDPERYEIIGVIRDVLHDGPRRETPPFFYFPQLQQPFDYAAFVFRTEGDPGALTGQISQTFKDVDSRLYALTMATLEGRMNNYIAKERLLAQLSTLFGLLALAVTCVGLYGLMAYSVVRRTKEIGLRMALGAQRPEIVRSVLGETLRLAAIGLMLGIVGALGAMRITESLLFGLAPTDPPTIAAAAGVMILVAVIAAWFPAIRAARIDPMSALRYE
jgi:predicted permease